LHLAVTTTQFICNETPGNNYSLLITRHKFDVQAGNVIISRHKKPERKYGSELILRTARLSCLPHDLPRLNTLRTGSFKLFKRPFPGFLTILTL